MPQPENPGQVQHSPTFSRILNELGSGYPIRQALFKKIEELTGRRLISYVAILTGAPGTDINPVDITAFGDLIRHAGPEDGIDLIINSFGGSPDVAEKIVELCRGSGRPFRVIVPNFAKSAATLVALGSDEIVMSDVSQLGPIDPQFFRIVRPGQAALVPAHSIIRSYEELLQRVNSQGKLNPADVPLLANTDLAYVDMARTAIGRSRSLAEGWLKAYMLNGRDAEAELAAKLLSSGDKYLSHGQVLNWREAKEELHLKVVYVPPQEGLWELVWELYVRSDMFCHQSQNVKLFESGSVSVSLRASPA